MASIETTTPAVAVKKSRVFSVWPAELEGVGVLEATTLEVTTKVVRGPPSVLTLGPPVVEVAVIEAFPVELPKDDINNEECQANMTHFAKTAMYLISKYASSKVDGVATTSGHDGATDAQVVQSSTAKLPHTSISYFFFKICNVE